jgi:hypothetical protein
MITRERIERDLTNHAPVGDHVVEAFEKLREPAKALANALIDICPDTPERDQAYLFLQQALMFGVASIARNQHMIDPTQ